MEQKSYDDIINLPHPVSATHPHMPRADRAAQFAPFAALTGYDAAIKETARLTDEKIELDEVRVTTLNESIRYISDHLDEKITVTVTYFVSDSKKKGGSYITDAGVVRRIDEFEQLIFLTSGTAIPIRDILEIESDDFHLEE